MKDRSQFEEFFSVPSDHYAEYGYDLKDDSAFLRATEDVKRYSGTEDLLEALESLQARIEEAYESPCEDPHGVLHHLGYEIAAFNIVYGNMKKLF
ncbi:hypothetical protein [Neptuniibacter sp. QD37_11]|uniref:hypothetical protein n=1 Tax=Neptuniibacter sp. QD37_11 TaxID=3398209 RepID=UPI0039F54517